MAATVSLGAISVLIGADASGLLRAGKLSETQLKSLERTASNVSNRVKGAILAIAGPAAMGLLIKSSMDAVGAQNDLALRLGATVAGVQTLERAAELAGIAQGEMASAADRMNRRLGEAIRDGVSPTNDALRTLGLTAAEVSKMDVDTRFETIADRIKSVGLNASQTADILGQLGIRGTKITTLVLEGSAAIKAAREQTQLFGVSLSNIDAQKIDAAGDAMSVFQFASRGVGNQLSKELSPIIVRVSKEFEALVKEAGGIEPVVKRGVNVSLQLVGQAADIGFLLKEEFKEASQSVIDFVNTIIRGANSVRSIPGVNLLGGPDIPEIAAAAGRVEEVFGDMTGRYDKLVEKFKGKLPSDSIKKWVEEARAALDADTTNPTRPPVAPAKTDPTTAADRKRLSEKLSAFRESLASEDMALKIHQEKQLKDLAEFEAARTVTAEQAQVLRNQIYEQNQKKLNELIYQKFDEQTQTELEQLAHRHELTLAELQKFEDNKTLTVEAAEAKRAAIEKKYAEDRARLQAQTWSAVAGVVDTAMNSISAIMEDESEKGFTIMKAIAYATALVKGYEAVVSAWATGEKTGIPGMGAVMAGIAAAGTAATIAKLAGVGSSSKGTVTSSSGSGGGGGGSSSSSSASSTSASSQSVFVSGLDPKQWMSGDNIKAFADKLLEYQKNGGKIIWESK